MNRDEIIFGLVFVLSMIFAIQPIPAQNSISIEQHVETRTPGVDVEWPITIEYENFTVIADYSHGWFQCTIIFTGEPRPQWENTPEYAQELYDFIRQGECYGARKISWSK
ncbi:MAG: hypothetical protein LBD41_04900 [Clostridiales Family XIII bacterium]|nr:hypothetical protein [Clostridiales Family XIII bacterium]